MVAKVEVINYGCEVCATKYTTLALAESCEQKCNQAAAISAKVAGALETFHLQATTLSQVFEFLEAAIKAKSPAPKAMKVTCYSPMLLRRYPLVKQLKERLRDPVPPNKRSIDVICFYITVSGSIRVKQGESWISASRINGKDLEIPGVYSTDTRTSGINHSVILPLVEWPGIAKSIEEVLEKEDAVQAEIVSLKKQFSEELAADSEIVSLQKEVQELEVSIKELESALSALNKKKTSVSTQIRKRRKILSGESDLQKKVIELENDTLPCLKEHHQSLLGLEVR